MPDVRPGGLETPCVPRGSGYVADVRVGLAIEIGRQLEVNLAQRPVSAIGVRDLLNAMERSRRFVEAHLQAVVSGPGRLGRSGLDLSWLPKP